MFDFNTPRLWRLVCAAWCQTALVARSIDKSVLSSAHIYGALRSCGRDDWGRAANELITTLIFGLFPIWVPLLLHFFIGDQSYDLLYKQVKDGQLFFLSTALLAPIFYFTFPSARKAGPSGIKPFPSQQILIGLFLATVIASVLAITVNELPAPGGGGIKSQKRMVSISLWLFGASSILYLFTLVVRNWLESGGVERILDKQSRDQDTQSPAPGREELPETSDDEFVNATLAKHTASE